MVRLAVVHRELFVNGDRSHLQQTLENFLFNARDAISEMRNHLRKQARPDGAAPKGPLDETQRQALIAAAGWKVARRSQGDPVTAATQIYLADTMGELGLFYRLAPVAFVAGSFRWQGHNPIEPALLGAAVLSGPQVANFQDIFDRMAAAGAVSFAAEAELPAAIERLLADAEGAGRRAQAFAEVERAGILERILAALVPVTDPPATDRPHA